MRQSPTLDREASRHLAIARHFVKAYLASRSGLKELGILRSERSLQGDFAEWYVSKLLRLQLSRSPVEAGFDAEDGDGRRYQLKGRLVSSLSNNTSFDIEDITVPFDFLIAVFLSRDFSVLGVIQVPYGVVKELGSQTKSAFRFRWNRHVAADQRIEKLIWPSDFTL